MEEREFEKLFWVIQPQLMRYARTRLDFAAAEDAVSNTLMTLLAKTLEFPSNEAEERALRILAFQVLNGHIRNEYRSRQRRQALVERVGTLSPRPESVDSAGVDIAAEVVEQSAIDHWLGQLSAEDQQVILLFNAGLQAAEIAEVLGCSVAAAAKRRARARNRLRAIVTKERGTM